MAKKFEAFVTGDKELDRKLKSLAPKLQKKYMRKATRNAAKKDLKDFKDNVPQETGALARTAKVTAIKRSRGKVGHQITIDREKLILERAARGGKIGYDPKRNEPFFYAAAVEFDPAGDKPLRRALYDNKEQTKAEVVRGLKDMIRDAEVAA